MLGSPDCLVVVREVDKWLSVTAVTETCHESQDTSEWCRGNLALFVVQTAFFYWFTIAAEVGRISRVMKKSRGEGSKEKLKPVLYPVVRRNSRELSIIQQLGNRVPDSVFCFLAFF